MSAQRGPPPEGDGRRARVVEEGWEEEEHAARCGAAPAPGGGYGMPAGGVAGGIAAGGVSPAGGVG
jgi:hypothetical protein